MAKQRYIDTRFWHDEFVVEELNPLDRYLFLYLLTNDKTNIAGVYECPMKLIAIETGIDREELPRMFKRFKDKIRYVDGWVIIKNFQKYQSTTNEKIKKGIQAEMSRIPDKIRKIIGYDSLSIPYEDQSHLNSNSNTNSNLNTTASGDGKEIQEIIFLFKEINPMIQKLYGSPPQRKAVQRMVKEFGREKLEEMIRSLKVINAQKYWPKSTTPVQLENNIAWYVAKKSELTAKQVETKSKAVLIT